jgi:hypothetical protein
MSRSPISRSGFSPTRGANHFRSKSQARSVSGAGPALRGSPHDAWVFRPGPRHRQDRDLPAVRRWA